MDRPHLSGTPGSSLHSAKFMINDQTDWCRPKTCCRVPQRRSYGPTTSLQKDLKAEPLLPGGEDKEGLGLENATLKWNEVVHVEKREEQNKAKNGVLGPSPSRLK